MPAFERILFATDFSECSAAAWKEALGLARGRGATLLLLHCYSIPRWMQAAGVSAEAYDLWETKTRAAAEGKLEVLVERARAEQIPVATRVCSGPPDEEIVAAAADFEADLVVLGTHGWRGLNRFLMGSVASAVVAGSPCPVLTVRSPEGEPRAISA